MEERRRSPRVPVDLHVVIHFEDAEAITNGQAIDISLHGVFLKTLSPLPIGTTIRLELDVGDEVSATAHGRVVRIVDAESGGPGVGVEFIEISDEARAQLDQLTAR